MKSYSLDHILAMSKEELAERYPHGVVMDPKSPERWLPAERDSEALGHRSLRQLVQMKRSRQIKPRFLEKNPGMARRDYTDRMDRAMKDEGEPVDAETQRRFTTEAHNRSAVLNGEAMLGNDAKVLANKLAKLKREGAKFGVDVESRARAMIADTQREIRERRRAV